MKKIALIAILGFVFNWLFWEYQPTVWLDEVSYADPSVNWAEGKGFTSSAWYAQDDSSFWSGNVPLNQMLLALWLKTTGVSEVSERCFYYVLASLAFAVIARAGQRLSWLRGDLQLSLFAVLFFLGDGISFACRSGRPDSITMLLAGVQLLACSYEGFRLRGALLFSSAMLAPWAGLQLAVYLAVMWAGATLFDRRRFFTDAAVAGLGVVIGAALLGLFYLAHGTLGDFLVSIQRHTVFHEGDMGSRLMEWARLPFLDRSSLFVFLAALVLGLWGWRAGRKDAAFPAFLGILILLAVPWLMHAAGTYRIYYSWMALIPAILAVVAAFRACTGFSVRALVLLLLAVGACIGLPARLGLSVLGNTLAEKQEIRKVLESTITRQDVVIGHCKFYYPLKEQAQRVYFGWYLERMTPDELGKVTVLVLDANFGPWPEREDRAAWVEVARVSAAQKSHYPSRLNSVLAQYSSQQTSVPYDMVILRRKQE